MKNKEIDSLKQINDEMKEIAESNQHLEKRTQEMEMIKLSSTLKQERMDFDRLKKQNDCMKLSLEVLHRRMEAIDNENKYLSLRLRLKEEEVEDFAAYNRPLEKAYKSLQRRYGMMLDKLEQKH